MSNQSRVLSTGKERLCKERRRVGERGPITHRKPVRFGDGLSIGHVTAFSKEKTTAKVFMSPIQKILWSGSKVRVNLNSQSPLGNERVPRWQL